MVKSPCIGCVRELCDKNNPQCLYCNKRLEYVEHISSRPQEPIKTETIEKKGNDMAKIVTVSFKVCPECGETLLPEDFHKSNASPDGLSKMCIECGEEKLKETVPQITPDSEVETKVCTKCDIRKPISEFSAKKTTPDGLEYNCKTCRAEYAKAYNQKKKVSRPAPLPKKKQTIRKPLNAKEKPEAKPQTDTQQLISRACDEIKEILLTKNRKYGDSAIHPKRIFSKASAIEQINVRIDDKLSRLESSQTDEDEDVELDLIRYLILKRIAMWNAK